MDIAKKISEVLEIPPENIIDLPKITMVGCQRVWVENYTALLDYKRENIRLKYKSGVIDILGSDMDILVIGEDNIVISGNISSVKVI